MKETAKQLLARLREALVADLEHGVGWINTEASKEFAKKYPRLLKEINKEPKQ